MLKFRSCKPHYLWLPLRRRGSEKQVPVGEVHLRVQWTSDEAERPMECVPSWALDVQLKGIGLSIIETTVLKFPREVSSTPPSASCEDERRVSGRWVRRCRSMLSVTQRAEE